jgi:hypothetical protein
MGASVQPDPKEMARIQANVAKMRAANAPESDVLAYLQHEDSQPSAAPEESMWKGAGRAALQGATFGFGDEMGLTDRAKESAFKANHPVVDFLAKMGGGLVAPAAAVALAPEAAGVGTAAAIGGGMGLLSGAGEADGSLADRAKGAAIGGLLGGAGGAAGYGLAKGAGAVVGAVRDAMRPERAVARAAQGLLDPAVSANLAKVNAIAPGGASLATAGVPEEGTNMSRFLPMLRGVGRSPEAGAKAEASFLSQQDALQASRDALGAKMDAVKGRVPVTADVRAAMNKVGEILSAPKRPALKLEVVPEVPPALETAQSPAPSLRDALKNFQDRSTAAYTRNAGTVEQRMARQALERHGSESVLSPPITGSRLPEMPKPTPEGYDIQDLRDALSRLRFMSRQAQKRGIEGNGMTLKDITDAERSLKGVIYQHAPEFAELDKPYAVVSRQLGTTEDALETVQKSRATHAANEAFGSVGESVGGSLHSHHTLAMALFDKLFKNPAGAADAVANLIAKPGGQELVTNLLSSAPTKRTAGRVMVPLSASAIPALRGLLTPTSP